MIEQARAPSMLSMQVVPFGEDDRLLLCRDVTQAEALARMRRDFIANVSHELKTPLTVVAGFVETMQDLDLGSSQRTRYLGLMQEQTRNMQRLVDDLLARRRSRASTTRRTTTPSRSCRWFCRCRRTRRRCPRASTR